MPNKLCADCGRSFRTRAGLFKHVNAVHKQTYKYKCQTCDKAFAEKHQLKAHLVQHGGDPVECHICQKRFTTAYSLKRHMAGAHENVRHTCATCKSVFADKDALKEHVSGLHKLQYRYVCQVPMCGAKYRWRSSLFRHEKAKHPKNWSTWKHDKRLLNGYFH